MNFKRIENLLEKFRNFIPPDLIVKRNLITILKNDFNININKEDIFFNKKTGVVRLNINSVKKTYILLNKENLLKKINNNLIKDII